MPDLEGEDEKGEADEEAGEASKPKIEEVS